MTVSTMEAMNAVMQNNAVRVTEILEGFDLTKDGARPFASASKRLASIMLGAASVAAWRGNLSVDLARELIERTAMRVNTFLFLRLVTAAAGIKDEDYSKIPEEIREALLKGDCSDKTTCAIEGLDEETFEVLVTFLVAGEIKQAPPKLSLPIMRYIYREGTVPEYLMFTCMGACLHEAADEVSDGGLLLVKMPFGAHDDHENEQPEDGGKCHCDSHGEECGGCHDNHHSGN